MACKLFHIALLALAVALPAHAQTDDAAALAELMQTLEEETEVATRTRMNRDFVPGMVSVLEGAELRDLGARTVWEGLAHAPGLQTEIDARGVPTLTARGIYFPFNSGSIQILLNGFAIGREDVGANGSALLLPMTLVERIEFVRGPGSVIYGDYAFQGLINIVTRSGANEVVAGLGQGGERTFEALHSFAAGDLQVSTALGWRNSSEAILPVGLKAGEQTRSLLLRAERGGLRLLAQGEHRRLGQISGAVADPGQSDTSYTFAGDYTVALGERTSLRTHAQYLHNDYDSGEVRLGPNSFALGFRGSQLRGGAEFSVESERSHWLLGVDGLWGDIDRASYRGLPLRPGLPPRPVVIRGETRRVSGAYAQVQLTPAQALQFTLGARYDDNGDIGSRLTPRASLVWQPLPRHVLKAQYAQGYRSPTVFELYGDGTINRSLDFEVNTTSELSYILRGAQQTFRVTAFRSDIDDMVFFDARNLDFRNAAMAQSRGVELEWEGVLAPDWRWRSSLSYVQAQDNRNVELVTEDIERSPNWLGGVGLIWRPRDDFSVGVDLNHVGARNAVTIGDGEYQRIDIALAWRDAYGLPIDVRAGIDNLGNARTVQIVTGPTGSASSLYQDRVVYLSLGWRLN